MHDINLYKIYSFAISSFYDLVNEQKVGFFYAKKKIYLKRITRGIQGYKGDQIESDELYFFLIKTFYTEYFIKKDKVWILGYKPVNLKSSVEVNIIHKNGIGNKLIMMREVCSPVMNPDEEDFLLQRQLLDNFSFPV